MMMRWALTLTAINAKHGERRYIGSNEKALLDVTDAILAEILQTLGLDDPAKAADDDSDDFNFDAMKVAS
jgi:hypothetical protein